MIFYIYWLFLIDGRLKAKIIPISKFAFSRVGLLIHLQNVAQPSHKHLL